MGGRRFGVILAVLVLAPVLAAQQTPVRDNSTPARAVGTAVLSGRVVSGSTDRPVRRAVVSLSDIDGGGRVAAVTDDTGSFRFSDLPASRFFLGASKAGWVSSSYGATKPNRQGSTIALTAGQQRTGVILRVQPGAVLTGTVRNRSGEPVPGARVIVLHSTFGYDTGERTLASTGGGFGEPTDDRGVYRVFGLPADEYFVVVTSGAIGIRSANELRETTTAEVEWARRQLQSQSGLSAPATAAPPPGPAVDYAPVFYPGVTLQSNAQAIQLKDGEERTGVDVQIEMTPTAKITGTVVSRTGALPPGLQVNVVAHDTIPGIPFSGFGTARLDASGHFLSAGLPPGDYTITVRAASAGGRGGAAASTSALFGTATVSVNGSDVDATVTLESGVTVAGRLVFEGTTIPPPPDLSKIRVSLTAVRSKVPTLGVPAVSADATGAFSFTGVTPGRYRLTAPGVGGWQLLHVMADGHDAADEPLEIKGDDVRGVEVRFTDLPTEISGDLLDATGHPAPEYSIIVFPADKAYWTPQSRRIQSTRPASDGRFRVANLPPGEYFMAAVIDVEPGEWYDPSFLGELVSASTKVTLAEGEKKVQSLRIKGGV